MMKRLFAAVSVLLAMSVAAYAQQYRLSSPDDRITILLDNGSSVRYSVQYDGRAAVASSPMGFEFKGEDPMGGGLEVIGEPLFVSGKEEWTPVIRNRHSHIVVPYNEMKLRFQEKSGQMRRLDITFRAMNDGIAFRYTLYGSGTIGNRKITKELTGFTVPKSSSLWVPQFRYYGEDGWKTAQEGAFVKTPVTDVKENEHAGLPGLMEIPSGESGNIYLAITEADIDNYPGAFLGQGGSLAGDSLQLLTTLLAPLPGEPDDGVKALFSEELNTPWRVVMIGDTPGRFIESEIVKSLNPPCTMDDTSWIKGGMCAWDHWWSGDEIMEQPVLMQYIDFAAKMGWPYMAIAWTWYGKFNTPEAVITRPAKQLDMPAIIQYAKERNIRIVFWLHCTDVNRNDQYKEAFKTLSEWGAAGVKIDFMDRSDQEMVNWYRKIIKAAADNHLLINLHGAYKPDGIERTYPNNLTREGVMGNENYKWANTMSPEHNVTLAFTRMLAGPMDYTPGGFLNVTADEYKPQKPTLVANTRAAELAKFVIYDSPLTYFCDHPDHVLGQPGADFVSGVPTEWDDTKFLGGAPDDYVALAKKDGDRWYIGVLNNSKGKTVSLDMTFLPSGTYTLTYWCDAKDADVHASNIEKKTVKFNPAKPLQVKMANAGGYTAIIERPEDVTQLKPAKK